MFKLAVLNSKKLSIKRKIFLLVTILCFLVLSFLFCFYKMYDNFIYNIYNNQIESKIISIYDSYKNFDKYDNLISNYENDNIVFIDKMSYSLSGFINNYSGENFKLERNLKGFMPHVIMGRNIVDNGEIVCPKRSSNKNFDSLKYNELTDMSDKLNKNITLLFKNSRNAEYISKSFKLVGLYDADLSYSYNVCFINSFEYEELALQVKDNVVDDETYVNLFNIYVNDYKNVNEINEYLKDNGINATVVEVDDTLLNYVKIMSYILLIIMVIVLTIFLLKFYKSYYQEEYYNIALYKVIGFNDKNIVKLLFYEIEIILFIAMIIASILLSFIILIVTFYLRQYVSFRLVNINFPFLEFIIYYLFISIFNYLFLREDIKKISHYSIKGLKDL